MKIDRRKLVHFAAIGGAVLAGSQRLAAQSSAREESAGEEAITRHVAEFIAGMTFAKIPPDVLELGKKSILDGFGLAFSGSSAHLGELARSHVTSLGVASSGATVIGTGMKAPPRFAAFLNGLAIHADDYDDTQLAVAQDRVYGLLTHPTAPALPPALAVSEVEKKSGRELLLAYHAGVEVECKIAEAINPRHYGEGFHSTGTIGSFGSAAAVAKLRHFDVEKTARTLGIAGSQASGLRENFGTMMKPFHAGHAAEAGVIAADFAALGWTATDKILEAPRGFFQAAGGGFNRSAIVGKLGNPWTFADPGVSIKPHPSGSLTHPGMTELRRILRENNVKADQVERLDVGTNRYMPTALIHHKPQDELQAKFSMEFCMAALILYGRAGLNEFTTEVVRRPEVQDIISRVHFGVDPEADAAGYNKMTTILTLRLKDGRVLKGRADFGKGSPANPMSYDEVAEKFLDCAEFAKFPSDKARKLVERVRSLEEVADMGELMILCQR